MPNEASQIEQTARGVIDEHGAKALEVVDVLAKASRDQGDVVSLDIWRKVEAAVLALQSAASPVHEATIPMTGMLVTVAAERAERWWSENRAKIRRQLSDSITSSEVRIAFASARGMTLPPRLEGGQTALSDILLGRTWADLTDAERVQVTCLWHEDHVLLPLRSPATHAPNGKAALH